MSNMQETPASFKLKAELHTDVNLFGFPLNSYLILEVRPT